MEKKRKLGYYMIVLILGAVVGSVLGDALSFLLPAGVLKQFFLKSVNFSVGPAPFNLSIIKLTLGFAININIVGVIGIFLVAYVLRWMD